MSGKTQLPNLIEFGGIYIKKKTDQIPEDNKKFIDKSKSVISRLEGT